MSENIKLKDKIYEQVLNEITEGHYHQNEIITERKLIEEYGVSKSPVREALIELCNEKVLESRPRMGYQIRPISMKEISDIVELRVILESAALRKTFAILEQRHIKLLKENLIEAMEIHKGKNIMEHWKRNISFHLLLCSFCENSQIYAEVERALKFSYRGAIQYFASSWNRHYATKAQGHEKLIEALEAGDLEKSLQVLKDDIEDLKRTIIEDFKN